MSRSALLLFSTFLFHGLLGPIPFSNAEMSIPAVTPVPTTVPDSMSTPMPPVTSPVVDSTPVAPLIAPVVYVTPTTPKPPAQSVIDAFMVYLSNLYEQYLADPVSTIIADDILTLPPASNPPPIESGNSTPSSPSGPKLSVLPHSITLDGCGATSFELRMENTDLLPDELGLLELSGDLITNSASLNPLAVGIEWTCDYEDPDPFAELPLYRRRADTGEFPSGTIFQCTIHRRQGVPFEGAYSIQFGLRLQGRGQQILAPTTDSTLEVLSTGNSCSTPDTSTSTDSGTITTNPGSSTPLQSETESYDPLLFQQNQIVVLGAHGPVFVAAPAGLPAANLLAAPAAPPIVGVSPLLGAPAGNTTVVIGCKTKDPVTGLCIPELPACLRKDIDPEKMALFLEKLAKDINSRKFNSPVPVGSDDVWGVPYHNGSGGTTDALLEEAEALGLIDPIKGKLMIEPAVRVSPREIRVIKTGCGTFGFIDRSFTKCPAGNSGRLCRSSIDLFCGKTNYDANKLRWIFPDPDGGTSTYKDFSNWEKILYSAFKNGKNHLCANAPKMGNAYTAPPPNDPLTGQSVLQLPYKWEFIGKLGSTSVESTWKNHIQMNIEQKSVESLLGNLEGIRFGMNLVPFGGMWDCFLRGFFLSGEKMAPVEGVINGALDAIDWLQISDIIKLLKIKDAAKAAKFEKAYQKGGNALYLGMLAYKGSEAAWDLGGDLDFDDPAVAIQAMSHAIMYTLRIRANIKNGMHPVAAALDNTGVRELVQNSSVDEVTKKLIAQGVEESAAKRMAEKLDEAFNGKATEPCVLETTPPKSTADTNAPKDTPPAVDPEAPRTVTPEEARLRAQAQALDELTRLLLARGYTPNHLLKLPKGLQARLQKAFQAILDLFNNPQKVFKHLQALQAEVKALALEKGISVEDALEQVLAKWELKHGFKPTIELDPKRDIIPKEEFMDTVISEGTLFKDPTFAGNEHGEMTHRIQWHVVMREMEENAASFGDVVLGSEIYKGMGDKDVAKALDWEGTGHTPGFDKMELPDGSRVDVPGSNWQHLWGLLFDNGVDPSRNLSSPEMFMRIFKELFPDLKGWTLNEDRFRAQTVAYA